MAWDDTWEALATAALDDVWGFQSVNKYKTDVDLCRTGINDNLGKFPIAQANIDSSAVGQAELKTSADEVSTAATANLTFSSAGQYGFYPQIKIVSGGTLTVQIANTVSNSSYATNIRMTLASGTAYANSLYVTASGDTHWIFALKDLQGNLIMSTTCADHVSCGNGGDPELIQHPFIDVEKRTGGYYFENKPVEISVINPGLKQVEQLTNEAIDNKGSLLQIINENCNIINDETLNYPDIPITTGLPSRILNLKTNKKELIDYRFLQPGVLIKPIKKIIKKPPLIKMAKLVKK